MNPLHGRVLSFAAAAFLWAASAGASPPLYRLPYPDHHAYTITQAPGGWISSHYGADSRYAVDFAMPEGAPVVAAREGVVAGVEWRFERGARLGELHERSNYVRVRHRDGSVAFYAHLAHAGVAVEPGETVRAGQVIGYAGSTGFSSGPHLHFAVLRGEVSEPIQFYVGEPPAAFAPRVGMTVEARYSGPAEAPPATREAPAAAWQPAGDAARAAWSWLVALLAAVAGMAWFYRFSRS